MDEKVAIETPLEYPTQLDAIEAKLETLLGQSRETALIEAVSMNEELNINPRPVFVEWRDATAVDMWLDKAAYQESINEGLRIVQTRGWLVHEADDFIAVARTVSKTAVEGLLLIPRCMIIMMTVTT